MKLLFFNTFVVVCGCGGAVVGVVLMIGGEIIELGLGTTSFINLLFPITPD